MEQEKKLQLRGRKLEQIRNTLNFSRPQFATYLSDMTEGDNITPSMIKNIETANQNVISDELALVLEKISPLSFRWWKTLDGDPYEEGNSPLYKEGNFSNEIETWGHRLAGVALENGYDERRMAKILKISVAEYDRIIADSPYPDRKLLTNIQEHFANLSISWLLFNIDVKQKVQRNNFVVEPSQKITESIMEKLEPFLSMTPESMKTLVDLVEAYNSTLTVQKSDIGD